MAYLPAKADPYDDWAGNTRHDWRMRVGAGVLEGAYSQLGRLRAVRVVQRDGHGEWGGRALQVRLLGTAGNVRLSGDDLRWVLGLPSTWFTAGAVVRARGR